MTPAKHETTTDPILTHARDCSRSRWGFFWKFASVVAGMALTIGVPIATMAVNSREAIIRQDERITALEKREEMLRADLAEIKADLKTLVQESRRKVQ